MTTLPKRFGLVGGENAYDIRVDSTKVEYHEDGPYNRARNEIASGPHLGRLPTWRPRSASGPRTRRDSKGNSSAIRPQSARMRIHSTGCSNRRVHNDQVVVPERPKTAIPNSSRRNSRTNSSQETSSSDRQSARRRQSAQHTIKPLKQGVRADRTLTHQIRMKLSSMGVRMSQLKQHLWALDSNKAGTITYDEFEDCLKKFNFGLQKMQILRLARTFDVDGSGRVKYQGLFTFFENEHPLGISDIELAADNITYAAPWHTVRGKFNKKDPLYNKDVTVPAWVGKGLEMPGTSEEVASLRFLTDILKDKFIQDESKIRRIFSKFDKDRNGVISKTEFLTGLDSLHLGIPEEFYVKLFDEVDSIERDGLLDYEEFVNSFAETNWFSKKQDEVRVIESAKSSPERRKERLMEDDAPWMKLEVLPSMKQLREKLSASKDTAIQIFMKYDVNNDGFLSKGELIEGINRFAPGLYTIKEIKSIMSAFDKDGNEKLSYDEFVSFIQGQEDEDEKRIVEEARRKAAAEEKKKAREEARNQSPTKGKEVTSGFRRRIQSARGYGEKRYGRFGNTPYHANTFNLIVPSSDCPGYLDPHVTYGETRDQTFSAMHERERDERRMRRQIHVKSARRWDNVLKERKIKDQVAFETRERANVESKARQHRRFMERARLYEFMSQEVADSSTALFTKNTF